MKKALLIVILLLCGASLLRGQVADSTLWQGQGEPWYATGKALMLGGAATAAAGGGVMLLALSPLLNPKVPEDRLNENFGPALVYIAGLCSVLTGASMLLAGIPVTVAGNSMMNCDMPWRDARYDYKGPGVIIEGGYYPHDIIEARATLGYHFNSHIFLGAGVAPGCWLDQSSRAPGIPQLTLPVYADFRWSLCNRLFTPYLGLLAGIEMVDDPFSPYLGAEIGTRVRTNRHSTNSLWSAISGEVAAGYLRVGIKMGYSF